MFLKCNIEYLVCVLLTFFESTSLHGIDTVLLLLVHEAVWHTLHRDHTFVQISAKNMMNHLPSNAQLISYSFKGISVVSGHRFTILQLSLDFKQLSFTHSLDYVQGHLFSLNF